MAEREPSSSTAITTSSSPSSLQGPRPAPLRVRRDSHNIRKVRQPVIIYTASPKVVHAEPSEFMSVVQRLTGASRPPSSSSLPEPEPAPPGDHQHSLQPLPFFPSSSLPHFPFQRHHQQAAPFAAVPSGVFDVVGGHSLPPLPSILSPVPGSLPAVPPSFFSPPAGASADAAGGVNLFGELISPAFLAATTTTTGGASEIMHPTSSLPSQPDYWDLFNNYHHNM